MIIKIILLPLYSLTTNMLGETEANPIGLNEYEGVMTWNYIGDTTELTSNNYEEWLIEITCDNITADLIRNDSNYTITHEEII